MRQQLRQRPLVFLGLAALLALAIGLAIGVTVAKPGVPGDDSAEAGFARDMAVHHLQAVEMANLVAERSSDAEVRQLARQYPAWQVQVDGGAAEVSDVVSRLYSEFPGAILFLIVALVAWHPNTRIRVISILVPILTFVQMLLPGGGRWVGALHPVNAILILGMYLWLFLTLRKEAPAVAAEPVTEPSG